MPELSFLLQTLSGSTCHTCFCGQAVYRRQRSPAQSRRSVQVRAEEESGPQQSTDKKDGRRLSFAPNSRSVRLQLQCSRIRPVLRHVHS